MSDAYLIAQVIRIDPPEETPFREEDLLQVRNLEHLRFSCFDQYSDLKRKAVLLLTRFSIEYEKVFSMFLVYLQPKFYYILLCRKIC